METAALIHTLMGVLVPAPSPGERCGVHGLGKGEEPGFLVVIRQ